MRKLIALLALSLSTSVAWAQTEKAPVVTKLPGEESLSTRERAERDFLMPVRRKKAAETPKPTASAEQLASAAPETDATAHYSEATPEPRTEEAAVVTHEARARRIYHHTRASRSTRASHSAKSTKASRAKAARAAKHTKASSRSKKAATHKSSSKKSSAKKTKSHTAAKKVKTKAKTTTTKHKRRR